MNPEVRKPNAMNMGAATGYLISGLFIEDEGKGKRKDQPQGNVSGLSTER